MACATNIGFTELYWSKSPKVPKRVGAGEAGVGAQRSVHTVDGLIQGQMPVSVAENQ